MKFSFLSGPSLRNIMNMIRHTRISRQGPKLKKLLNVHKDKTQSLNPIILILITLSSIVNNPSPSSIFLYQSSSSSILGKMIWILYVLITSPDYPKALGTPCTNSEIVYFLQVQTSQQNLSWMCSSTSFC